VLSSKTCGAQRTATIAEFAHINGVGEDQIDFVTASDTQTQDAVLRRLRVMMTEKEVKDLRAMAREAAVKMGFTPEAAHLLAECSEVVSCGWPGGGHHYLEYRVSSCITAETTVVYKGEGNKDRVYDMAWSFHGPLGYEVEVPEYLLLAGADDEA